MENEKKTGYVLYDFMKEELSLSGVALQVYALIYSFTKAGGDCHASIKNIAKRIGTTPTSVKRAIKDLIEQDYIVKTTNNQSTANHYIANRGVHHVPGGGTFCSPGGYISDPNNKEDNKEDNNTNLLTNH